MLVAACVVVSLVTNSRWYSMLQTGDSDETIIECLAASGIRAATADYWIAYRMTFLADERVIVNPDLNVRYRPYAETVRTARPIWIQYADPLATGRKPGPVICKSATLEAVAVSANAEPDAAVPAAAAPGK